MPDSIDTCATPGKAAGSWPACSGLRMTSTPRLQATLLREAAQLTEGFSGRELAKLMASVQSAAYATPTATLTPELFRGVVQTKLEQHEMRLALQ